MITQGWPLWAVRKASGAVYAVVGWEHRYGTADGPVYAPIGVELAIETDDLVALILGGPLAFVSDRDEAWKVAGA